jgi:GTP-binding protein
VKAAIAAWGDAELYSVQVFSSLKRTGIDEAERVLAGWFGHDQGLPENRRPPDRGVRGPKCLDVVKTPAQGG